MLVTLGDTQCVLLSASETGRQEWLRLLPRKGSRPFPAAAGNRAPPSLESQHEDGFLWLRAWSEKAALSGPRGASVWTGLGELARHLRPMEEAKAQCDHLPLSPSAGLQVSSPRPLPCLGPLSLARFSKFPGWRAGRSREFPECLRRAPGGGLQTGNCQLSP